LGIVIKPPLPPSYVSLRQFTIFCALLYEFPRLILLICIRLWYKIKNKRAQIGVSFAIGPSSRIFYFFQHLL
jgi:uncharacterized membrane protein